MTRRKILLISIPLIILLLGVGGFFYVRSDSFLNNFVKTRLKDVLQDQIDDKYIIQLKKLRGNIFTGVEIENLSVKEKESETSPIFSTKKITLKYNFFALLQRKFLVTALEIDSPEVNLQRNAAGQVNLTQVLRESEPPPDSTDSFAFAVSNVKINEGKIVFTDTQQNIELELPNIKLELGGSLDDWNHTGNVSFNQGSFTLNGTKLSIDPLKKIEFSVSTIGGDLPEHKLKFGNSVLTMKGNWEANAWEVYAGMTIDASDVQKFLGDNIELGGSGVIVLDLKGTDSTLNGTLTGTSDAFSIKESYESKSKNRQIDISDLTIDTTINLEEVPKVTLDKFSAQIADGTLTGSGSATFKNTSEGNLIERLQHFIKQPITYDSNWQISDIQLYSLLSMFGELSEQIPQIESGTLTGTALINGNTTGKFHLDSNVKLSDTGFLVKNESIPLKNSSLNYKISAENTNGSNVSIDGIIDDTKVDISGSYESLDVQLGNVDFGKLSKIFNSIPFEGVGSITAKIKKDGTANGYAEIPEAFYRRSDNDPIPVGRLTGNFRYVDRVVYFENAHLTKEGENGNTNVSIEGNISLEDKLSTNFRIVAEPLVLDADYNKLFFIAEYPIEGNIKGELNLYGQLIDHLDGSGNFVIDSGNAWSMNLDPATLELKIDDYSLTIPNFVITTRGQVVTFNAHVGNNGDFDFSLKNSPDRPVQLTELARAAGIADFPLDGKMDINMVSHQKKQRDFVFEVNFDFSDLTFEGNPLGDADLHGVLIEQENHFKFTGKAFEGTSSIEGTISNTLPNPYKFTLKSKETAASPILRIFHPALDVITGTVDSTVEVEGTISELVGPSKKRVYPYDVDIVINKTQLQYNVLRFTNLKPMLFKLENDILTISDSSLSVAGENTPFIQLIGTIDAKTKEIDIASKHNQDLALESFGTALGLPISGTAQYELKTRGTLTDPIVDLKWKMSTLVVKTDIGDIGISDANGEIEYQNNTLHIKPFSIQVLENLFGIDGNIAINPDDFNNSKLNFNLSAPSLNLLNFSHMVRNSMPAETVKRLSFDKSALIQGKVGVSLNVAGTIAEPIFDLNARTTENQPIHFGAFAKPIILDKLHARTTIREEAVQIQNFLTSGQIGTSDFQINGETLFSTRNRDKINFDMDISLEELEIGDLANLFLQRPSPVHGTLSGAAKLSGTGFTSALMEATCKIDELNLQAYNHQISNTSPIDFKLHNNNITSLLPLQVSSSIMETKVDVNFDGPFTTPNISAKWQGTLNHLLQKETESLLQWQGDVKYADKQIKLDRIELTNNGNILTLNGMIPFDLSFANLNISERFIDAPINVQLTGKELPLTFFPWLDNIFSEAEGVTDINLTLQGTTRTPYLKGNVFLFAPHLRPKSFTQPLENVTVQIMARENVIELAKFQFNMEDGTCNLAQCKLQLDGLTPERFELAGLTFKQYPLGLTLRRVISEEVLSNLDGNVTATLTKLSIPFDSFFENGEETPIPKIREVITFDRLSQKTKAEFSIDDISLGFVVLDQQFSFKNSEPIPITLDYGTFRVQGLKLENTAQIPANVSEQPIVFSCFGSWNMQGEMSANLKLDNFNISILDPLLPSEYIDRFKKKGMLSTNINIIGTYAAPEVTVKLVGHELGINQANIDEFTVELRYSYANKEWTISENTPLLRLGENRLSCSARVPYLLSFSNLQAKPLSEEMEIKIDFQLEELEVLPLIQPLIESANGEGRITATIGGTPMAPQLIGDGEFNAVDLEFKRSPVYFQDTNAEFDFSESKITIDSINGQLNGGNFSANGEIIAEWLKVNEIDLNASLDKSSFIDNNRYQVEISADNLHLSGNITDTTLKTTLAGDIEIYSGHYRQDWNWQDLLDSFTARTVSETDLFSDAPILRDLTLNLGIDMPNSFHLVSSTGGSTNIEITCRGGRLTGPIQRPIFSGTLFIPKGQISIVTQIFEIDEGSTITNPDETAFNPELDIRLKTPNPIPGVQLSDGSTADLEVTATIIGKLENGDIDKAKLSFGAEPLNSSTTEIFSDADVLALLSPGNSFSRSFRGITFTISSGLDPNERHIIAEYPLPNNMSIKVEGDEKGEFGVDIQLLERRF